MCFVQEQETWFTLYPPPAPEQFKNFVLMFKENHLVFAQKSTQKCRSPSPSSTSFFFARDCSTEWKNNECVASPHRPIDVTFSKQFFPFFFFLQDFGLRQCCKSILLSPNVSRWMCVEAVKVNDRSLTHSWWFQVEEKEKKKKLMRVNRHLMEQGDSRRGCSWVWRHAFCCSRISGECQEVKRGCLCLSCCFRME